MCSLNTKNISQTALYFMWQENLIQTGLRKKKKKRFLAYVTECSRVGFGKARPVQGSLSEVIRVHFLVLGVFSFLSLTFFADSSLRLAEREHEIGFQ